MTVTPPNQDPGAVSERERAAEAIIVAARAMFPFKPGWLPGVGKVYSVSLTEAEHHALWDALALLDSLPQPVPERTEPVVGCNRCGNWLYDCQCAPVVQSTDSSTPEPRT